MSDRVWLYIDVLSMIACQCTTAAAAAAPPVNTRSSHDNAWLTYADNQAPTSVLLKSHSRVVRGEAVSLHHTAPTSSSSHPSTVSLHGAPCVLDVLTVAYLFSRHFSQILNLSDCVVCWCYKYYLQNLQSTITVGLWHIADVMCYVDYARRNCVIFY